MASTLKKVAIAVGSVALIGMLLFTALIALVIRGDNTAKAKATALCGSVTAGMPAGVALERAIQSQSATHEPQWHTAEDGSAELLVAFPAWLPLTGYLCSISARDGVVTASNITTVD